MRSSLKFDNKYWKLILFGYKVYEFVFTSNLDKKYNDTTWYSGANMRRSIKNK